MSIANPFELEKNIKQSAHVCAGNEVRQAQLIGSVRLRERLAGKKCLTEISDL